MILILLIMPHFQIRFRLFLEEFIKFSPEKMYHIVVNEIGLEVKTKYVNGLSVAYIYFLFI